MDASLKALALSMAMSLGSLTPSDGSTLPLQMKITTIWKGRRLASNYSLPISYSWSSAALGFLLNLIGLESPTMFASTDPVIQITAELLDYQATLPTFGMPSLLRCIDLTFTSGDILMTPPLSIHLVNLADVSDSFYMTTI